MTNEEISERLNAHFIRIVNAWRDHSQDFEAQKTTARIVSMYCGLPQWIVLRIANDMGVLCPEMKDVYKGMISDGE